MQSKKQILWPKNATQISFEHNKHEISRVGNLDIPEYQDSHLHISPLVGNLEVGNLEGIPQPSLMCKPQDLVQKVVCQLGCNRPRSTEPC